MNTKQRILPIFLLAASLLTTGCGLVQPTPGKPSPARMITPALTPEPTPLPASSFILTSTAFADGEKMPAKYVNNLFGMCGGENYSPPLSWSGTPAGTRSYTLMVVDPDGGNWIHWVQFNIPGNTNELSEAIGGPDIGIKGGNSFLGTGYGGPCPPSGTHNYVFTLYALDAMLALTPGASKTDVDAAMQGHILGQANLTGKSSH